MKATNNAAPSQNEHPPLARDAQGNLLALPEGTAAWRIFRQTKGRPAVIKAPDKQPARFPLDTTVDELAESCGADTYRVYALDEVGNVLDYITTVDMGPGLRNAAEPELPFLPSLRTTSGSSDLRYALEAVTHIARTNAEAMRAVAESQAEWIKSISSARGFFRNAPQLQLPAPVEDQRDDDEEEEHNVKTSWLDALQPVVGPVVQQLIMSMMGANKPAAAAAPKFELSHLLDWRRAAQKREELPEASPDTTIDPAALQQMLARKAVEISGLLEPAERARLMRLAPLMAKLAADPGISPILADLVAKSPEDAAAWLRANIDEIERGLS